MRLLACLLLPAALIASPSGKHARKHAGPVSTAKEAKAIAEQETHGKAVSAQRIPLNGASGGWEVDVHMPNESRGWHCIIDSDTHMVHSKSLIDNPPLSSSKKKK